MKTRLLVFFGEPNEGWNNLVASREHTDLSFSKGDYIGMPEFGRAEIKYVIKSPADENGRETNLILVVI